MRTRQVNEGEGFGAFFGEEGAPPAAAARPRPRRVEIALPRRRTSVDALLPLINIVFLLLIFLMMSGTIGTPVPGGLSLARSRTAADPATVAGALVVLPDGQLRFDGAAVDPDDLGGVLARGGAVPDRLTVVADGDMAASAFLGLMRRLSADGVGTVSLVTANAPRSGAPSGGAPSGQAGGGTP